LARQARLTLAAIARDARFGIDQRQAPADQPVEQRRFADVRAADDRDTRQPGPSRRP